jgi:hypothetical protein
VAIFNSYSSLKTEVFRWINREDDPDADDRAASFIELGESRIRRNQEWYTQIYSLENGGQPLSVTANPTELPPFVKTVKNLWASTDLWKGTIEILPISAWRDLVASNRDAAGIPTKAIISPQMDKWMKDDGTRQGPKVYFWPAPGFDPNTPFAVDFQYIRDTLPLSEDAQNNGLFLRYPDLYLAAALAEAAVYYQHDDRLQIWEGKYQQAVKEINIERERAEFGASAKRVRLPRSF